MLEQKSGTTTDAGVIADVASTAIINANSARPIQRVNDHGAPFVVLLNRDGSQSVQSVADYAGPRKKASVAFVEAQSFIDYVNLYSDPHSRVFCDLEQRTFSAVLDYHTPDSADDFGRRGQHKATFVMKTTPVYEAWRKLANAVAQAEFAEFLEDHYSEIEEPDGGTVLDIAKELTLRNDVAFKSAQRTSDGGYNISYNEDVRTDGVTVPAKMLLAMQVFQGGPVVRLPVRLRYRLLNGGVAFWLVFLNLDELLRAEVQKVRTNIADAINRPVWAGSVTL